MQNEVLTELKTDLNRYKTLLKEAATTIREQGVSEYPIFIAHKQEVNLGLLLFDREKFKCLWSISASTLEEFVAKNVILSERIEQFKSIYKHPEEAVCIFVLNDANSNFIFYPYK